MTILGPLECGCESSARPDPRPAALPGLDGVEDGDWLPCGMYLVGRELHIGTVCC
jgi:hypothetical protein